MNGIKVTCRDTKYKYIDFIVNSDNENIYRYEEATGKIKKLFGIGKNNFGKAIRGKARQKIEEMAKIVYKNNLPFAIFEM